MRSDEALDDGEHVGIGNPEIRGRQHEAAGVGSELQTHRHQVGEEVDGDLGGRSVVGAVGLEELVDRIDDGDRELATAVSSPASSNVGSEKSVRTVGAVVAVEREVEVERNHDELHAEIAQHRRTAAC